MIQLQNLSLDKKYLDQLKKTQDEINKETTYEAQIGKAEDFWKSRKNNKAFAKIKELLTKMCSGVQRCCYCEDSRADEIEHFKPKVIFPENCFDWDNYLYACGICNGPKNNKFAIFRETDNEFQDITPPHPSKRGSEYIPTRPPEGDPALINPRISNPMDFMELDIINTFKFSPISEDKTSQAYQMAIYTIETLGLNDRADMPKARRNAFNDYFSRFYYYNGEKVNNADATQLQKLQECILKNRHPTVWKEMIRWYNDPNLNKGLEKHCNSLYVLFKNNPEVLNW